MKLSHQKFIEHYIIHGNASEAYSLAYPNAKRTTCATNAEKLLRRDDINKVIKSKQLAMEKKNITTKEDILLKLKKICDDNIDARPAISIKALELMVKMQGYITPPTSTVTTEGGEIITINLNLD